MPDPQNGLRGQKIKTENFSKHGHVAYQIEGNYRCGNMVAKNMPANPPPPTDPGGLRLKIISLDKSHAAHQIKGNHECRNLVANIFARSPPPSDGQNSIFCEHGHVAYQRESGSSNMVANADRGTIKKKY